MKPKYRSAQSLSISFIAFSLAGLSTYTANAANRIWSGATSAVWSTSGNWNTLPIATDTATFNSAGNGKTTIDLGVSGATIQILTFDTVSAAAYTIGAGAVGSQTLTLGNAGLLSVTSTVTKNQLINANLTLGNATASTYSLTNSSPSNSLTVAGAIQGGGAGAKTLTLDGVGTMNVSGAISNGLSTSLAVVANSGLLTLSGANTYTGGTTISGNTLQVSNFGNQGSTTSNLGTGSLKFGTTTSTGTLKYTGNGETANRTIDLAGTTFGGTLDASGSGLFKLTSDFTATGAGDKTLTLTGSGAGEIAGKIVDNSGSNTTAVTKSGNNTWTLSGANTYTGLTTVSAGTLAYGISNAIASGAVQVSGGTLDIGAYSDTVGAITLTGGSISGSTGVLTGTSYAMQNGSVSAILAGSAALTKTTSGTVTLSNSNTYTGITTISAGVLSVSSLANGSLSSNIGQSTNAAANLVLGGGTLQYTGSSIGTNRNFTLSAASNSSVDVSDAGTNLTLSGASTNTTGGLIKIGAGKLTLSGANLYTGLTDVQVGTLAYGANNTISSGAVQVSGGTLDISSYSDTVGAVTLAGGNITGSTGVLTGTSYEVQSGSISAILAGAVALNKTTSGTVTLSGTNTYTGVNTVSAGTLRATTSASALGTGAASLTLSGGTLELANDTGLDFARNTTLSANSTVNSDVLTPGAAGVNHSLGTLTLTGQTLTIGSGANVGSGTAGITFDAVAVNGGAVTTTFNVGAGDLLTLGAVTPAGGGSKVIAFGGNGDTTVSGVLNDAAGGSKASVTKSGNGTLILANANLYDDATTISGGVVRAQNNTALGTSGAGVSVSNGAALELDGAAGALTIGAEALTLNGNGISSGGALRNVAGNNSYAGIITLASASRINSDAGVLAINSAGSITGNFGLTFGGAGDIVLSDAFAPVTTTQTLTKDGAGKLTLNVANTYTGLTTVSAGTLEYGVASALSSGAVTVSGGTLDLKTFSDTVGAVTLTSGNISSSSGVLTGTSYAVQSGSISAILAGASVGLTKTTAGTVTLSGANNYTGTTSINAGTLSVSSLANGSSASNLGQSSNAAANLVFGGGSLQYTGATVAIDRSFTLTANTSSSLEVVNALTNLTISGASTATNGAWVKTGAGTLTLSGANQYTGLTDVQAGTLAYGVGNALSSGAVTVSGGTWDLKTFSDTVGAVTLTSGNISSSSGVLTGTSYAVQSGSVGAILAGNGTLTKTTAGTVTLSGANTYTGLTAVQAGTLNVQNAAGLGGTSTGVSVSAGAAMELQGGITVGAEALSLSGTGVSTNGALRNISGNNTYGGLVTLGLDSRINSDAGRLTLDVASGNAITGSYNLTFGGAGNITVADVIATSTGTLTKDGAGTLILSGANTYTGLTTVSAGTLALGANNTLTSAVTVSGGILDTATFSDSVGAVTLTSGSITGNGTLTGTSYALQSGNVSANLGTGNVTVTTGNTILCGTSASTAVAINSGKLTLGASNRLADAAAVTINGGILDLAGFSDTVATMALTSGSITGGTLTSSAAYDAQSGSVGSILAGSVGLNKTSSGTVTLTGANTYTGKTTISGGTLAIGTNGSIAHTSEVSLGGGNFNVSAVTGYALGSNQSLTGSGLVSGDLTINGTLAIGASPGTINFNNDLTLGLGSVSNFEFTSGSFGALSFDLAQGGLAHTVSFGGTLNLFFKSDETFAPNTSVKIFDFGYYAGNFSAVNVSGMGVGTNATFDSSTGIVTVIPEPGAALLGGLGLLVILRRRRA